MNKIYIYFLILFLIVILVGYSKFILVYTMVSLFLEYKEVKYLLMIPILNYDTSLLAISIIPILYIYFSGFKAADFSRIRLISIFIFTTSVICIISVPYLLMIPWTGIDIPIDNLYNIIYYTASLGLVSLLIVPLIYPFIANVLISRKALNKRSIVSTITYGLKCIKKCIYPFTINLLLGFVFMFVLMILIFISANIPPFNQISIIQIFPKLQLPRNISPALAVFIYRQIPTIASVLGDYLVLTIYTTLFYKQYVKMCIKEI